MMMLQVHLFCQGYLKENCSLAFHENTVEEHLVYFHHGVLLYILLEIHLWHKPAVWQVDTSAESLDVIFQ